MATKENESKNITGLDNAENRVAAEYDLVEALLSAAEFKSAEENLTDIKIMRNGVFKFKVTVHPLSDGDVRLARKKATTMMPNPNGKKLPPIEKEFDNAKFTSWLIYLATVEEDQKKIWGNPAVMQKFSLSLPVESIDILLNVGEKRKMADTVLEISGMNDEDDEETMDEETFL